MKAFTRPINNVTPVLSPLWRKPMKHRWNISTHTGNPSFLQEPVLTGSWLVLNSYSHGILHTTFTIIFLRCQIHHTSSLQEKYKLRCFRTWKLLICPFGPYIIPAYALSSLKKLHPPLTPQKGQIFSRLAWQKPRPPFKILCHWPSQAFSDCYRMPLWMPTKSLFPPSRVWDL